MSASVDTIVVGGGLVGAAVAWGLAREGETVTVIDEGDIALRASRGNFGLVWVQTKGKNLFDYARWGPAGPPTSGPNSLACSKSIAA